MAKLQQKLLNVFGQSSTRLVIVDCITKNGNRIGYEDLIEKVMSQLKIQRQSVRWHLRKMIQRNLIERNGDRISLKDPVEIFPSTIESWPFAGIVVSLILFLVSYLLPNVLATLIAVVFLVYTVAVNIRLRSLVSYLKKLRR